MGTAKVLFTTTVPSGVPFAALPKPSVARGVVGGEIQRSVHDRRIRGGRADQALADVLDPNRARWGSVAPPKLAAGDAIVGREEERAVYGSQIGGRRTA